MRRVLVTGAGGRLGTLLIPKLINEQYEVVALSSKSENSFADSVVHYKVDWSHLQLPELPRIDCVIHLAQQTSAYQARKDVLLDVQSNLVATIRLLEHLKVQGPIPKFVFMGSLTEYGMNVKNPINEKSHLSAETFYDAAKIATENYLGQYFNEGWIEQLITLRLGNLYGLGSLLSKANRGFFDNSISLGAQGKSITCYGEGNFLRDFIHSEDVLDGLLKVIDLPSVNRNLALNISTGVGTTVRFALELINTALVKHGRNPVVIQYTEFPEGAYGIERRSHVADITMARTILNWVPSTSLLEGIEKSLNEDFVRRELKD